MELSNFSELNIKKHRERKVGFLPRRFRLPNTTVILENLAGRQHLGHSAVVTVLTDFDAGEK